MEFYCSSDFCNSLSKLISNNKYGYSSCRTDIVSLLKDLSFEELLLLKDNIYHSEPFIIKKTRVANSGLKLSKRDGFRLLLVINVNTKQIALLYVFPKRGKYSMSNVNQADIDKFISDYVYEFENNLLKEFCFSAKDKELDRFKSK